MKPPKITFGIRMWALKQARKELMDKQNKLEKEKQTLEEQFRPIAPLEQPITASMTLKPIEVTATVPNSEQKLVIQPQTAMDIALQKLREQASKL